MPRMLTVALVAVLVVMAGCAAPPEDGADPLGPADLEAFGSGLVDVGEGVAEALEADRAVRGMAEFPPITVTLDPMSSTVAPSADEDLPRGSFAFDPGTSTWVEVGPSANLRYAWPFVDAEGETRQAVLVVDWGTTSEVVDVGGGTIEVPTDDMTVTLTIDTDVGAAVDVALDWYSAPSCPAGVFVPTSGSIDGTIGIDATVALNEVGFTLADASFGTSGEIVATAGTNAVGVDWDIDLGIAAERGADCFIDDVEVIDGSVAVAVFATDAGTTSRLALSFGFSDVVVNEQGVLESVALSGGQVRLNGSMVVAFTGTLDGADGDGLPGEDLMLTFADGTTMTLEAYLQTYVVETTTVLRRAWSLLR